MVSMKFTSTLLFAAMALAIPAHHRGLSQRIEENQGNTTQFLDKRADFTKARLTWYGLDTGADACTGKNHKSTDNFVAISMPQFGSNGKSVCGKKVAITYKDITRIATVVDACFTCTIRGQLDATEGLFKSFGVSTSVGVLSVSWSFVGDDAGDDEDTTTTHKTTSTSTHKSTSTSTHKSTSTSTTAETTSTKAVTTKTTSTITSTADESTATGDNDDDDDECDGVDDEEDSGDDDDEDTCSDDSADEDTCDDSSDDDTSGDDDSSSNDDDTSSSNDDDTSSGDDEGSSGGDDTSSGDDTTSGGDDTSSGAAFAGNDDTTSTTKAKSSSTSTSTTKTTSTTSTTSSKATVSSTISVTSFYFSSPSSSTDAAETTDPIQNVGGISSQDKNAAFSLKAGTLSSRMGLILAVVGGVLMLI